MDHEQVFHFRSLGYEYNNAEVEKQGKFLNRMSGFVRLYAAMIVTTGPPEDRSGPPHPYGIEHAWIYLGALANLAPHPEITATILYDFMSVAGHTLYSHYGKQYSKLQALFTQQFLEQIKMVTPGGISGPFTRLEGFLNDCKVRGYPAKPDGMIPDSFWRSALQSTAW